jgi:hypothetical protein
MTASTSSSTSTTAAAPTVRFACRACGTENTFDPDFERGTIACGRCDAPHEVECSEALRRGGPLDRCPVCGRGDFWRKKDFPRRLGLGIVIVAAILAFYTYGISLIVASLLDLAIYRFLSDMAVCYGCRAEVRGAKLSEKTAQFDLPRQDEVDEEVRRETRAT